MLGLDLLTPSKPSKSILAQDINFMFHSKFVYDGFHEGNEQYVPPLTSLPSQEFIFSFFCSFFFSFCPFSLFPNLLNRLQPRPEVNRDHVVRNTLR